MAALNLFVNYKLKKTKLVTTGAVEDVVTVKTRLDPVNDPLPTPVTNTQNALGGSLAGGVARVQFVSSSAWGYHSVAGQVATDAYTFAANTPQILLMREGDVFYLFTAAAATIQAIVLDDK